MLLAASYGDRAEDITRIAEQRKLGRRLVKGYPVLEAEVVYAVQHEYCETPEDFIARRSRLAFLDTRACAEALPRVQACLPVMFPHVLTGSRVFNPLTLLLARQLHAGTAQTCLWHLADRCCNIMLLWSWHLMLHSFQFDQ